MCNQLRKKSEECFAAGYRNWNTTIQTNQRLAKMYASQRTYQKDVLSGARRFIAGGGGGNAEC